LDWGEIMDFFIPMDDGDLLPPFHPDVVERVLITVKNAGEEGFNIGDFLSSREILAAGYLTAKGLLAIKGGGGQEPYILVMPEQLVGEGLEM
jgi:hypothetical protein